MKASGASAHLLEAAYVDATGVVVKYDALAVRREAGAPLHRGAGRGQAMSATRADVVEVEIRGDDLVTVILRELDSSREPSDDQEGAVPAPSWTRSPIERV